MGETQILDRNLRKVSIQESFAPKTPNFEGVKQVPHSEQATGQGMHCRKILFIPHCSPRTREFRYLVNFSVRRTVAELRGFKVAQFSDFGLFSPYKTPKTYVPVTSLCSQGVTSQNDSDFYRAMRMHKRGICCHPVSVRPSVYPSVCLSRS